MIRTLLVATALAMMTGIAVAQTPPPGGLIGSPQPSRGQMITTPQGSAVVTGSTGSMATTIMLGGGSGLLMNNGNGTSTLTVPGRPPTVVPTAR